MAKVPQYGAVSSIEGAHLPWLFVLFTSHEFIVDLLNKTNFLITKIKKRINSFLKKVIK